jgi:hypothetical protein
MRVGDQRAGPVPSDVNFEARQAAAELSVMLRRFAAYGLALDEDAFKLWRQIVGDVW